MCAANSATRRSFAQCSEHNPHAFRRVADRTGKKCGNIAAELQRGSFPESRFRAIEQFGMSHVLYTALQTEHPFERVMRNAVVATFVLNAVEIVPHSVDVYSFTIESRLTVQVLDRFLNL